MTGLYLFIDDGLVGIVFAARLSNLPFLACLHDFSDDRSFGDTGMIKQ